jgi:hypothetical protein
LLIAVVAFFMAAVLYICHAYFGYRD